ncbi:MAG: hypothetical protein ACLPLP_21075 [Mycobacterium sp.]
MVVSKFYTVAVHAAFPGGVSQRICLGFKEATIAEHTLQWRNRDLQRHPALLTDYVTNTSPAAMPDYGDDSIDTRLRPAPKTSNNSCAPTRPFSTSASRTWDARSPNHVRAR